MFSIILFILLTFFLLTRLFSILGIDVGFKVSKAHLHDFEKTEENVSTIEEVTKTDSTELYHGFDSNDFLMKAKTVFSIVFESYASCDVSTLQTLLTPKLFSAFELAINDRKIKGDVLQGSIERFISADIINTSSTEEDFFIVVRFITEQSNVLKDKNENIIEGSLDFIEKHSDVWTFNKKIRSSDKKWLLFEIQTESI